MNPEAIDRPAQTKCDMASVDRHKPPAPEMQSHHFSSAVGGGGGAGGPPPRATSNANTAVRISDHQSRNISGIPSLTQVPGSNRPASTPQTQVPALASKPTRANPTTTASNQKQARRISNGGRGPGMPGQCGAGFGRLPSSSSSRSANSLTALTSAYCSAFVSSANSVVSSASSAWSFQPRCLIISGMISRQS